MWWIIGIGFGVLALVTLWSMLVVASDADEAMERMHKEIVDGQ